MRFVKRVMPMLLLVSGSWTIEPRPWSWSVSLSAIGVAEASTIGLEIRDSMIVEGNSGPRTLVFPVTVSGSIDLPVSVHYQVADATGKQADGDYVATSGTLTIDPLPPAFALTWGSHGDSGGQFNYPFGIALDPSGNVYVVDMALHRIQKFDSNGNFLTTWGTFGSQDGQLLDARGVGVDKNGIVYVADTDNYRIQKFDGNGNFLGKWGSQGTGDGQFDRPYAVAIDSSARILVVDRNNNRIQKFSSSGAFLGKWGSLGSGDGQFNRPYDVAVASNGVVYVVDRDNSRIQEFDANGNFLGKWGTFGSGNGQFAGPYGVALDGGDDVYVVDRDNSRLQKFDSNGNFLAAWGSFGTGDGQFNSPARVAATRTGQLFVTDQLNDRAQKFLPATPTASIGVQVNGDVAIESNETLTVTLSSPVGAVIVRAVATGTIVNDDGLPPVGVSGPDRIISALRVRPAPNPSRASTTIRIETDEAGAQEVLLLDLNGRVVRHLQSGSFDVASRALSWDGRSDLGARLPAGIYLVRLRTLTRTACARLVLLD